MTINPTNLKNVRVLDKISSGYDFLKVNSETNNQLNKYKILKLIIY